MTPIEQAREALQDPLSRGPTWALIERYADAVCEYNTAVRIDVGIDKAGADCLAVEKELRAHLAALSAQEVPAGDRVRECAQRLVDGASWNPGGILSDKSKACDIPSKAYSQVKARHLASLRDALAAAPAAPKQAEAWMPISSAPKDEAILVCCTHGMYVAEWRDIDIAYWHVDDNKHGPFPLRGTAPTHWMPLPSAPAAPRG